MCIYNQAKRSKTCNDRLPRPLFGRIARRNKQLATHQITRDFVASAIGTRLSRFIVNDRLHEKRVVFKKTHDSTKADNEMPPAALVKRSS
ncbi:hypothetical protein NPIL_426571 [Nephila pilipes]|uniref:Uncharacterized protein n=1 Tax=Nephila pilipes TaxID=299642 RepID=A0A8X6PAJ1_NEPPI|nr:hypothetical protein NPIL_426571 [Nephila pilipes]